MHFKESTHRRKFLVGCSLGAALLWSVIVEPVLASHLASQVSTVSIVSVILIIGLLLYAMAQVMGSLGSMLLAESATRSNGRFRKSALDSAQRLACIRRSARRTVEQLAKEVQQENQVRAGYEGVDCSRPQPLRIQSRKIY